MSAERAPGEVLIDLYVDIARIRSLSVEEVAEPKAVMGQAIQEYGVERGGIEELSEAELAQIGRKGLHAYFAQEDQRQAEERLRESEGKAVAALRDFIYSHHRADMRVTQTEDITTPMIDIYGGKPVSSAIGRISTAGLTYPYTLLNFTRRLWFGRHDIGTSTAEIFRGNSLEPRARVDFL